MECAGKFWIKNISGPKVFTILQTISLHSIYLHFPICFANLHNLQGMAIKELPRYLQPFFKNKVFSFGTFSLRRSLSLGYVDYLAPYKLTQHESSSFLKKWWGDSLNVGVSGEHTIFTSRLLLLLRSVGTSILLLESLRTSILKSVGLSSDDSWLRLYALSCSASGSDFIANWGTTDIVVEGREGDICCLNNEMFLIFFSSVGFLKNLQRK